MKAKSRLFSIISGVLVILILLNDIDFISMYFEYDLSLGIGAVLLFASLLANIALIVFLFMNDIKLAIIPYSIKVFVSLVYIVMNISLYNVLSFVTEAAMLFIIFGTTVLSDKIDKNILKRIWFIPAIVFALSVIVDHIIYGYFYFSLLIEYLIVTASYLTIAYWALDIYAPKAVNHTADERAPITNEYAPKIDGYYDLLTHILLLLFTCGVWQYIWVYKTTSYLNNTPGEEQRNPTTKLLLCMFVPFYNIYWTYKSAQRIDKLAVINGQQSDISTLCLVLSIFVGIVPPIIMQEKINNIVKPEIKVNVTETPISNTFGAADEIKKYKELLDEGVITQDEFDAKKKQLLGL